MTPPPLPPALAPSADRNSHLDTARGLAILGLIFSNIPSFASVDSHRQIMDLPVKRESWELYADFALEWLLVGKCVSILSFLLGVGLALQHKNAEAAGQNFAAQTARRMAVLLGIGVLHIFLLWYGDILCAYAILGFAFLLFYRIPPVGLRWIAFSALVLTSLLSGGCASLGASEPDKEFNAGIEQVLRYIEATYQHGPIYMLFLVRLGEAAILQFMMIFIAPLYLGVILMGYDSVRSGWFPWRDRPWPPLVVGLLGASGVIFCGLGAWLAMKWPASGLALAAGFMISTPATFALAAAYLYGFLRIPEGFIQRAFAAVGRTALSNYLLQSLCGAFIFQVWGLGLYGSLSLAQIFAVCLGIIALQLSWPGWWLRHFRFGPMEYLWRRLSYGENAGNLRRRNVANVSPDSFAE
jgi:uncharacterized protein